ncbi:hypothetical protein [Nocardioides sp. AE5]|uniref:hypothetical protein n=1 Tax=Nocardioides sp. AE5 TaxID=2962573 RepID=UPI0028826C50|nr:hypothetical protein [Nocardioides sp. AE5]MDT0203822.1 hypothetical protein [Nocardioides sp. AE5]
MSASADYCELCDMSLAFCPHGQPKPAPAPEPAATVAAPRTRAPRSSPPRKAATPRAAASAKQPVVTKRTAPRRWSRPEDFEAAIVVVLTEAGGELANDDALAALEELLADRLTVGDREKSPTGELRWHLAARKARQKLINEGRMSRPRPGVWALG